MALSLKGKIKGTKSVLNMLNANQHRALVKGATNTAGGKVFIQARRAVKKRYNVTDNIGGLPYGKIKATAQNLTFKISAPTKMVNIGVLFKGAKQTNSGTRVSIVKGRKALIKGAFIARPQGRDYKNRGQKKRVTASKDLVLTREGRSAYVLGGVNQYEAKGTNYAGMLMSSKVKDIMKATFREEFDKNFAIRLRKLVVKKVG